MTIATQAPEHDERVMVLRFHALVHDPMHRLAYLEALIAAIQSGLTPAQITELAGVASRRSITPEQIERLGAIS